MTTELTHLIAYCGKQRLAGDKKVRAYYLGNDLKMYHTGHLADMWELQTIAGVYARIKSLGFGNKKMFHRGPMPKQTDTKSSDIGNEAWRALSETEPAKHDKALLKCKNQRAISIEVVLAMVADAKMEMKRLCLLSRKRCLETIEQKEYDDARSWLRNGNGGLEDLLSMIYDDPGPALEELKEYADKWCTWERTKRN